jgi:hypothetical protein
VSRSGPGRTGAVAAGARLMLEGVELSRLASLAFHGDIYMAHIEEEGFKWEACVPGHMIVYIEHLRRPGTFGASSIAGYISGVNSFFTRLGIAAPGYSDMVSCSLSSKALRRAISGGSSG